MSDRGKASFVTMDFSGGEMKNIEQSNIHTPEIVNVLNKGFEEIEEKGLMDFSKSPILNTAKKVVASNKTRRASLTPLPDDLKAGLDKASRFNRIQTSLNRNGSGPATGTIMADRQAAGKHLTGLRPNADAYRGGRKVSDPIRIPYGVETDSFYRPGYKNKELSQLLVNKSIKE